MKFLKSSILTLLVLIALLMGYMVFHFDTDHLLNLSADAYEKQQYDKAHKTLKKIESTKRPKTFLVHGYVLRAQKKWQGSSEAFKKVYECTDDSLLKEEALFNLSANAYLKKDWKQLDAYLMDANPKSSWSYFFKGLKAYKQNEYEQSLAYFQRAQERKSLSLWMSGFWNQEFSKENERARMAHCLIESGEPKKAREILLSELSKSPTAKKEGCLAILALTYLKEAAFETDFQNHLKLLALAQKALLQMPKNERLGADQTFGYSALFLKRWDDFALNSSDDEWIEYAQTQTQWALTHDTKLELSISSLLDSLSEKSEAFFAAAHRLKKLPLSDSMQKEIEQQLLNEVKNCIQHNQVSALIESSRLLSSLLSFNETQDHELKVCLKDQIENLALQDKPDLDSIYQHFIFWDAKEREEENRSEFLRSFYPVLAQLWQTNPPAAFKFSKFLEQFEHYPAKKNLVKELFSLFKKNISTSKNNFYKEVELYYKSQKRAL